MTDACEVCGYDISLADDDTTRCRRCETGARGYVSPDAVEREGTEAAAHRAARQRRRVLDNEANQ